LQVARKIAPCNMLHGLKFLQEEIETHIFFSLMDVNEWMSYECSDEGTYIHNIHNLSTRSHASEDESRTRNRSKNSKCKQALKCL
jgi:hypothetical protein